MVNYISGIGGGLVALYAFADAQQKGGEPINSLLFAIFVAAIFVGLVRLVAHLGNRFRIKEPGPAAWRAGQIGYGVCCFIAAYSIGMAIYVIYLAYASEGSLMGTTKFVFFFLIGGLGWWAIGRGIRYLMGH